MASGVKDIIIKIIPSRAANIFILKNHYSRKFVQNSQLHFGVYLDRRLEGVLQFGPPMDKRKMLNLVEGTGWNEFIELNRLAFTDYLPKNSESRCIAWTLRFIKKNYPQIKWVISYADACQCGDGTIYRATGFVLTAIKTNKRILRLPDGSVCHALSLITGKNRMKNYEKTNGASRASVGERLIGYQIRYIYFLDPKFRPRLTVPEIPYSEIKKQGAGMYRGKSRL